MAAEKPTLCWGAVGSAVLIGIGFVGGLLFRRIFPKTSLSTAARAAKKASLLAQGHSGSREYKLVLVVRTDLGMGKGKIAAQCSHAAVNCFRIAQECDPVSLELWEAFSQPKICLKVEGEAQLRELYRKAKELKIVAAIIRDAGHTQVSPGTVTVLGIGPAATSEINKITGDLKLL